MSFRHYIYVSKDATIRGYFWKPKGVHEQKRIVITNLSNK